MCIIHVHVHVEYEYKYKYNYLRLDWNREGREETCDLQLVPEERLARKDVVHRTNAIGWSAGAGRTVVHLLREIQNECVMHE